MGRRGAVWEQWESELPVVRLWGGWTFQAGPQGRSAFPCLLTTESQVSSQRGA